nr:retrovirus-related Pol polyprotein from transposon TNT 1-94 [Tanacetum cinerariifolium]
MKSLMAGRLGLITSSTSFGPGRCIQIGKLETRQFGTKINEDLGSCVACDGAVSTHVFTCCRVWVISPAWLKERFQARLFVGADRAVLRARAKPGTLFKGFEVCIAAHMQPLNCIVRSANGNIRSFGCCKGLEKNLLHVWAKKATGASFTIGVGVVVGGSGGDGGKEVNMAAGDSDDALFRCVENTIKDRIMDSGASFHATDCKEELERFKLRSGKVRLADDMILDIAGVGDIVLKTSFGKSWTLKDVRYIPGLKRRLISVGQLDEKGYHVGFGDQQRKVTKGSLVVARGNKLGSLIGMNMLTSKDNILDVQKLDIYFCKLGGLGKQKKLSFISQRQQENYRDRSRSCGRYNANLQVKCLKFDNGGKYSSQLIKFCVENGIVMPKMVSETPLQFGVAERLSRTFRAESTGLRAEAPKMLWAYLLSAAYLIYRIPYVLIGVLILEEE